MASYAYYHLDDSILSDHTFELICKKLLTNYDSITHPHKHLLDLDSLRASTGYDIIFPEMVKDATLKWLALHK